MATLESRIAALEQEAGKQLGMAERFRLARERLLALTPEQIAARREARKGWTWEDWRELARRAVEK